jgi:hypothetical protein
MSQRSDSVKPDRSLPILLDLDGTKIGVGTQYWVKISAWVVEPDETRPHGIRYELTLHDAGNRRILGFDNAHAVKRPGGRFVEQPRAYDHLHRGPKDAGAPYAYWSAGKLVGDFWKAVFKALEELGESL